MYSTDSPIACSSFTRQTYSVTSPATKPAELNGIQHNFKALLKCTKSDGEFTIDHIP